MKEFSILLGLDGSAQCRYAIDLCFELAKSLPARITAQHVADAAGLWTFLAFDTPGLIGSGPFLSAHEAMRRELRNIGETLAEVYKTGAESAGIQVDCQLDEGSVIREIYQRAQSYDLVVTGHRSSGLRSPAEERRKIARHSVAERLVYYLNKPLLVVQDRVEAWKSVTAVISTEGPFLKSVVGCAAIANLLALPLNVCFWVQTDEDEKQVPQHAGKVEELLKANGKGRPEIKVVKGEAHWWMPNIDVAEDSLLVIPTVESTGRRETPFGTPPDVLLRHCRLPAILFCPDVTEKCCDHHEMEEELEVVVAD